CHGRHASCDAARLSVVYGSMEVTLQLGFDRARILTLRDTQHPVHDHFAELCLAGDDDLEFRGHWKEEEVGETDAVHGSREGGGDSVAELARVSEILQHGHQSQYRADDTERG